MLRSIWENFDWLAHAVANEDISLTGIWQSKEVYFSVGYFPIWERRERFKQTGEVRGCKPLACLSSDNTRQLTMDSFLPNHAVETPWWSELQGGLFHLEMNTQKPRENTTKSHFPRQSSMTDRLPHGLRHPGESPCAKHSPQMKA